MLLRPALRTPLFQPVWKNVHRLALWGMNIGPGGYVEDSGEEWVLNWCASQTDATQPFVLLDGGANVGQYATTALRLLGDRLRMYCFEPSPRTFAKLSANLADEPRAHLMPFGLSDHEFQADLYSHAGGSAEASLARRDMSHWGIQQDQVDRVTLRRLDDFCESEGLGRIDFLKLDVEGHELPALRGAGRLLDTKAIRFIQFEFGAPDVESRTFFKDLYHLLAPNYGIYRIVHRGLAPIPEYSEFHETFTTVNFLAVAR